MITDVPQEEWDRRVDKINSVTKDPRQKLLDTLGFVFRVCNHARSIDEVDGDKLAEIVLKALDAYMHPQHPYR